MTTYYAVCDAGGPISVRIEAESLSDALDAFAALDGRAAVDCQSVDAEDDLDISGSEMDESEFGEALESAGLEMVYDLETADNAHAGTTAHVSGGWRLWRAAHLGDLRMRARGAKSVIESGEDWAENLGYHVSLDSGDYAHPICSYDVLDEHADDDDVLACLRDDADADAWDTPAEAALDLIAYARAGLATGRAVEAALREAVEAASEGDAEAAQRALGDASSLESEYGDDPATRAVAEALGLTY